MADMIHLRPYQREAIDRYQDAHAAGMNFPAVVLPTGSGKTVIFAHGVAEHIETHNNRVLILVHRDELADQAVAKLAVIAPSLKVGKVKAEDDDVFADVIVASVQTASRKERLARLVASQTSSPDRRPRMIGLIVTDEVHHGVAASYQKIYKAFPKASKVGFTATLARGDGVGLGSLIDDVVFSRSWLWMIGKGYLVDPKGTTVTAESLDLSHVTRSGSDYAASSLGEAMIDAGAPEVVAAAYREHASDRSGIVFMPSVSAAYLTAAAFDQAGITADVVEANTAREERLSIYERSRTGRLQVIVNCGVLTEGADFPWVSAVVPRITQSVPLFQQMVGRALRPYPGKADALVLSIGGMSGRLRTLVDLEPGSVREMRPGETLLEAVEREETEGNAPVAAGARAFRIKAKDTDMFAGSKSMWLRTQGGVMFIPVADGEVFLWPGQGGLWDVRHAPRKARRWPALRRGMSLEMAMAWAETDAEDLETGGDIFAAPSISKRSASWRRKKEDPSPGQLAACRTWGVTVPTGATKAQVSDLLSVRVASLKFDPHVARMAAKEGANA